MRSLFATPAELNQLHDEGLIEIIGPRRLRIIAAMRDVADDFLRSPGVGILASLLDRPVREVQDDVDSLTEAGLLDSKGVLRCRFIPMKS